MSLSSDAGVETTEADGEEHVTAIPNIEDDNSLEHEDVDTIDVEGEILS